MYDGFARGVGPESVGELVLADGESLRGVKVSLRRASTRLGQSIDIWDSDGRVYFKRAAPKRTRRRRSQAGPVSSKR